MSERPGDHCEAAVAREPLSASKVASRVSELLRHVDHARQASEEQCVRLLLELAPHLQAARTVERQRDRHLAHRFNVFNYLRVDELGLSRMIADLLDPTAEHGQGTSFLEAMLDALPETRARFGALRATKANPIKVVTERRTTAGMRIDITVDIPFDSGSYCLAFENKPYAYDQDGQLKAYLEYLGEQYGTRFLLVYLPPDDHEPDEASLPPAARERWRGHFRVMPYAGEDTSLEDWFATCRNLCDAERVKFFLRDAKLFCRYQFGGSTMTTDAEARSVGEYLSNNPSHMRAAFAVHRAWPAVRQEVCERFLKRLRHSVEGRLREELPDIAADFHVRCHYGGDVTYSNRLWITRDGWRSKIQLQSHSKGPNDWLWGVSSSKSVSKMTGSEKERRKELVSVLRYHGLSLPHVSDWWPQWEAPPRYRHWDLLVPDLYEECEAGGGPVTTFYVDGLLDIALHAIPAINKVETADRASLGE